MCYFIGICGFFEINIDKQEKEITQEIPYWVIRSIEKNGLILSAEEKNSLQLLDINGDQIMDAIFIRDVDIVFLEKNGTCLVLNDIRDEENDALTDFTWVDSAYIDSPLSRSVYPYLKSKGQVLVLVKQTSGSVYIFFQRGKFHWCSMD